MFELPLGLERNGVLQIIILLFCIISDVIHKKNVQFIVLFNLKKCVGVIIRSLLCTEMDY